MSVPSAAGPNDRDAAQLAVLRLLEDDPSLTQRGLSKALGLSLGKTHYVLKALLAKGWVKAKNFQRSDNKLGYLYVLTPNGVRQRFQLTQSFLERKEHEYETLKGQIAELREELRAQTRATSE